MEPMQTPLEERLTRLIDGLVLLQGRRGASQDVAKAIAYSAVHAQRLFKGKFEETPAQFRRRLVLERAAERLSQTDCPVWQVAAESGFASTEPFLRAFRRAYRVTPGRYRGIGTPSTWLPTPNSLHYWRGSIVASVAKGKSKMNLTTRMIDHDLGLTSTILDRARTLTDEQLDAPMDATHRLLVFEETEKTLRDVLDAHVFTKEVWINAMLGRDWDLERDRTIAGINERWKVVEPEFRALVHNLEAEDKWDDLFVDALCTPPETFSFGSVIAHILTFSACRRTAALREFRKHGIEDLGYGDPIEWERGTVATACL